MPTLRVFALSALHASCEPTLFTVLVSSQPSSRVERDMIVERLGADGSVRVRVGSFVLELEGFGS